jgi:tRNA G18 (ribose-2'-O)-methylase SpoU
VLRVSMGTALKLPIVESVDPLADLLRLRDEWQVVPFATVLASDAEPLSRVQPPPRWALVFGEEGDGLPQEWIAACPRRVTIPMRREVDSLNVSVAAGILMHHFLEGGRQWVVGKTSG